MPLTITPGVTFQQGGGQEYTAAQFNSAFTDMDITGIDRDNMSQTARPVTVSGSAPSTPQIGELWYDSSTGLLKLFYSSTEFNIIGPISARIYTAQSTIAAGDVVVLDTANADSVKTTTNAAGLDIVVGIALTSATAAQDVYVQSSQVTLVNCTTGAVSIGSHLAKSATAGKAEATTNGNAFAIAITSKGAGSEGTVSAIIVGRVTPGQFSASFSTYSVTTNAALSAGTFYDFPNAALGTAAVPIDGGSTSMKVDVRTSRANQPVTLTIIGLDIRTDDANDFFDGYKIVIRESTNDTQIMVAVTKNGNPGAVTAFVDVDGEEEDLCAGAMRYRRRVATSDCVGISVQGSSVTFTIPVAGTYTIRPQWRAGASNVYVISGITTATLLATVH